MDNSRVRELAAEINVKLPFDKNCVACLPDNKVIYSWLMNDARDFLTSRMFNGIAYSNLGADTVDSYAIIDKDFNVFSFIYYSEASEKSIKSCLLRCSGVLGIETTKELIEPMRQNTNNRTRAVEHAPIYRV